MDFELDNSFGFSMREEMTFSRPEAVWRELSIVAGHSGHEAATPLLVAQLINDRANPTLAPSDILRNLIGLAESAQERDGEVNADRLSTIITQLQPTVVAAAIKSEENMTNRRRALQRFTDVVSPEAVLVLARASAAAYGRPLSTVLNALLSKLAREAQELPADIRVAADHAFRDLYKSIVRAWSASSVDMTSSGYESMFSDHHEVDALTAGSVAPEPMRVIELAFESGAIGGVVWTALARVSDTQQGVRRILDMIKRAPQGSRAADLVAQQFANPVRLTTLLHEDPVDLEAVDALLERMGEGASTSLLDAVADSKSRATRRFLLDRLGAIGPSIGTPISERLKQEERWYVQRNLLIVLRESGADVSAIPLEKYTQHADARVRREAMQLMMLNPLERDRALASALRDSDVAMLKVGLKAARDNMPESVVPILAKRVIDPEFPPEFRTSALQLLSRSTSILGLEALLRFVMGGTTILGKQKLAPKSPEMLIALSGLARAWPNERRAMSLVALARDSKDPDIVKAAAAGSRQAQAAIRDVLDDE